MTGSPRPSDQIEARSRLAVIGDITPPAPSISRIRPSRSGLVRGRTRRLRPASTDRPSRRAARCGETGPRTARVRSPRSASRRRQRSRGFAGSSAGSLAGSSVEEARNDRLEARDRSAHARELMAQDRRDQRLADARPTAVMKSPLMAVPADGSCILMLLQERRGPLDRLGLVHRREREPQPGRAGRDRRRADRDDEVAVPLPASPRPPAPLRARPRSPARSGSAPAARPSAAVNRRAFSSGLCTQRRVILG